MTIEEEKKLVTEKLMGWVEHKSPYTGRGYWGPYNKEQFHVAWEEWKPESECKWWNEIWEKMEDEFFEAYHHNILSHWDFKKITYWHRFTHTVKPEICWKALVKAIIIQLKEETL